MTPETFIRGLRLRAIEGSIQSVLENLQKPPGRKPSSAEVSASAWFHSLSDDGRRVITHIIRETAEYTAFNCCCVLDGVAVIESGPEKSEFKLVCVSPDGTETILNPPDGDMLHDVLNASGS